MMENQQQYLDDILILEGAQLLLKEPWAINNECLIRGSKIIWYGQLCQGRKLQKEAFALSNTWQEDMLREVRLLQSLQHPSLCQYLGLFFPPNIINSVRKIPYFVYGNSGYSLQANLHESKIQLQPRMKISIAQDISSALAFLHTRNVIHRGVNAENIYIYHANEMSRAKLGDFGLVRCIPIATQLSFNKQQPYIPPEARSSEYIVSPSWDVYSYGILLLELLSQEKPLAMESFILDPNTKYHEEKFIKVTPREHITMLLHSIMNAPLFAQLGMLAQDCLEVDKNRRPTAVGVLSRIQEIPSQQESLRTQLTKRTPTNDYRQDERNPPLLIDRELMLAPNSHYMPSNNASLSSNNSTGSSSNSSSSYNVNYSAIGSSNHLSNLYSAAPQSVAATITPKMDRIIVSNNNSIQSNGAKLMVEGSSEEDFKFLSQYLKDNRHRKLPTTFARCIALIHDNKLVLYELTQGEMYVLEPKSQQWSVLADNLPIRLGGVCVYKSKLIILGGFIKVHHRGGYDNVEPNISLFSCHMTEKKNEVVNSELPNMLYCHKVPATLVYNDYIIVIGGDSKKNAIEVYDPMHNNWYVNTYIPSDSRGSLVILSACIRYNMLYLAITDERSPPSYIYNTCLDGLSQVKNNTLLWNRFSARIPTCSPRLICTQGLILAVGGGQEFVRNSYTKEVYKWNKEENEWMLVTFLKQERKLCGVVPLHDGSLFIAGGNSYLDTPEYLDIQDLI